MSLSQLKESEVVDKVKILVETLDEQEGAVFLDDSERQKFHVHVIDSLRNSSTYVISQDVSRRVVVRDFDPECEEFTLEVVSEQWENALFHLVNNFFEAQAAFYHIVRRPEIQSVLQLPSTILLRRKFYPNDNDIPVDHFYIGNQCNPFYFTPHIKLTTAETDLEALNRKSNNNRNRHGILADFEHDRDRLTLRFGYAQKRDSGFVRSCVHACVQYSSIRRVIVNWESLRERNARRVQICIYMNAPLEIRRANQRPTGHFGPFDRFLTWDDQRAPAKTIADCPVLMVCFQSVDKEQLYNLLSRLQGRCKLVLEFCTVRCETAQIPPPRVSEPMINRSSAYQIERTGSYALAYLIEALSSRGAIVNDHLLKNKEARDAFVNRIVSWFYENPGVTLTVLERLLNTIDEKMEIRNLMRVLERLHEKAHLDRHWLLMDEEENKKNGLQRVRKIVITPTRRLYVVPELMMGNRFLRTYNQGGHETLRIQFRDDDGRPLRSNKCGQYLIGVTVRNTLRDGIFVAGHRYKYMGSSNSQLRDNGCYLFNADDDTVVQRIREEFGRFDTDNIPKFMSRFGQCFTQARKIDVKLERAMYAIKRDVIGGDDQNYEPYIFSDGVGSVSLEYATQISTDLNLRGCVPSVYQIRFRGMKGIICIDPYLDSVKQFLTENSDTDQGSPGIGVDMVLRHSQEKFQAPRNDNIEVVKYSSPVPLSLNRPMINIMDQVTAKQNHATHVRLCRRIHELLGIQLDALGKSLNDEIKARERLSEFPRRIDICSLSPEKGFHVTDEPFFRSLLQSSVQYTLGKIRSKIQINVLPNQGRMLFGVVDESGLLQYGQIFCQLTSNIFMKMPGPSVSKHVLEGPVLMTKNPAIVASDVRMFQAVNIPELHHLVDVVVFPRYGPRPHSDEMAGSDLDGDEYAVIWDTQLFFNHNEEAFIFPKPVLKFDDPEDQRDVTTKMIDFYVDYIQQGTIGAVATAFLAQSDQYGISSELCLEIARKHSLAVDFPKTGKAPEQLTRRSRDGMPPEQPDRYPDFMERNTAPAYISGSLNGQLYRRARHIDAIITQARDLQTSSPIVCDPDFEHEGFEQYLQQATIDANRYNSSLSALLDNYGIADEAQAFTGMITKCRNRISDKDNDDMSLFNTNYVIKQRVNRIFKNARLEFFEEFGSYESCTVEDAVRPSRKFQAAPDDHELDRRYCKTPTEAMKQKASAYYKVCYYLANKTDRRFLSFAWVCWDVLAEVKKDKYIKKTIEAHKFDNIPRHSRLHEYIMGYVEDQAIASEFHCHKKHIRKYQAFAAVYARAFQGVDELFFILRRWGEQHQLFNYEFTPECLNALLILHGINDFPEIRRDISTEWLQKVDADNPLPVKKDLKTRIGGLGAILLQFFKFLGSSDFKKSRFIPLSVLGCMEFLPISICEPVSQAANDTYYTVVFTGTFESLPALEEISADTEKRRLHELDPFTIELPASKLGELPFIESKVKKLSGVHHVTIRKVRIDHYNDTVRLIVSATGTLASLEKLRELVFVKSHVNCPGSEVLSKARLMADMVYEKLSSKSDDYTDHDSNFEITNAKIASIGSSRQLS
ncbi:hypothetical protein QR680_008078 [Steinernema hermaphroditum]|uniref:RNA-directed RNA polymerase n=1 Tax=Steinernema hermaphroditum TaxID=289476 RepID=A0AA39IFC1_9BILA|nr:hypothetical protein QR680_008078 [Steinernema hermaphroditum]